jgi:hypothetical protein
VGELPNSHGPALRDKSYVLHGIRSGLEILVSSSIAEHLSRLSGHLVHLVDHVGFVDLVHLVDLVYLVEQKLGVPK